MGNNNHQQQNEDQSYKNYGKWLEKKNTKKRKKKIKTRSLKNLKVRKKKKKNQKKEEGMDTRKEVQMIPGNRKDKEDLDLRPMGRDDRKRLCHRIKREVVVAHCHHDHSQCHAHHVIEHYLHKNTKMKL